MKTTTANVFVYGTLMRGMGNHSLVAGSGCLGTAWTVEEYAMYVNGIPYVTRAERVARIMGEVYEVDAATLARLDGLEGHPGWYVRDLVQVELASGGDLDAWLYFMPRPHGRLVPSGDFRDPARPFARSYWVERGKLLAGAYPGEVTREGTARRMGYLLDAGVRSIVNLQHRDEVDHFGKLFTPYTKVFEALGAQRGLTTRCRRFPIEDLGVASHDEMRVILDFIDTSIEQGMPVYVHCWGGVGRTGTVVGCWLRRHGKASAGKVLDAIAGLRKRDPVSCRPSPETRLQRQMARDWKEGR